MKGIQTLILALALTSLINADPNCSSNCQSCGPVDDGSSDVTCYVCGYGMLWTNGVCEQKNPDVNCAFHSAAGCLGCNQGWYLNMDTQKCEKPSSGIQGCYAGGLNPSGMKKINGPLRYSPKLPEDQKYFQTPTTTCNVCDSFYPSADFSQCNGTIAPADNCSWGALDDYGKNHCMKCKSGYISKVGVCQTNGSGNVGCIYLNSSGMCVQCTTGYYMKTPGTCAINKTVQIVDM